MRLQRGGKFLQLLQRERTDLVAGLAVQRQFDDAVLQLPGKRLPLNVDFIFK